ncbi:hypothetical protein, partial [Xanthomonas vasicola]|uniref:hypothetical protein n=1 Tax=Xanthomonas vasicola TaxID=56459 RepID=UPI001C980B1E
PYRLTYHFTKAKRLAPRMLSIMSSAPKYWTELYISGATTQRATTTGESQNEWIRTANQLL